MPSSSDCPAPPSQPADGEPDLQRFVDAQAPVIEQVRAELRAGEKRTHWMWFVFPQLRGLGRSTTARHFGLAGREEAAAYAAHPVLGARLRECCALVLAQPTGRSAHAIFGSPDDLKLCSSMTLFEAVAAAPENHGFFALVLDRFCGGKRDAATLVLLAQGRSGSAAE